MLSKKFLLKQFTQRLTTSFSLAPKRSLPNYLRSANFTSTTESENETKPKESLFEEPRWMRFFKGMEPNPIDLERAVKNDNVDLLNNYVKMNYIGFDFAQLVTVMGSLSKIMTTSTRLFTEIKARIALDKYEANKKVMMQFLTGAKDFIVEDEMMRKFTILELEKVFDQCTHKEQSEIILFMFEIDFIKTERVIQYLSKFEELVEEGKIEDYINNLTPEELLVQVKVFDALNKNIAPQSFNKLVNRQILDFLANKVISAVSFIDPSLGTMPKFVLEFSLPSSVPSFFTNEQAIKLKAQFVNTLTIRHDTEDLLGSSGYIRMERVAYKLFQKNFTAADRYLVENPLNLLIYYIKNRMRNGDKFDPLLVNNLPKFGLVDLSILDTYLENLRNIVKNHSRKIRIERPSLNYIMARWKILTDLNFDEAFKSVDSSEKQDIIYVKAEFTKIFERALSDLNSNDELDKLLRILVKQPENPDGRNGFGMEDLEMDKDDPDSLFNALKEELGEIVQEVGEQSLFEGQPDDSKTRDVNKYQTMLEKIPDLVKEYNQKLKENKYFNLNYFDKALKQKDIDSINDYLMIVDVIPTLFLFEANTDGLLFETKRFFARKEQETIFEILMNYPNFLENLILIDLLAKDFATKIGEKNGGVFPDNLRVRIYQEKRKIDDLYQTYNGQLSELFKKIDSKLKPKMENTNEVNLYPEYYNDSVFIKNYKLNLHLNRNSEKYQKEIDFLKIQENEIAFKFSNKRNVSEVFGSSEENLYVRFLNSQPLKRMLNNSYLKKIVSRVLTKMEIPYVKDHCDFPFVADFLLFPKEDRKIIIQVTDPDKLLLGVENVRTIDTRKDDFGFSKHGYTIINFRPQDFDIEEEAMIEKIKSAINNA